jgi:two-component system, NtrC family, response regulator PilR
MGYRGSILVVDDERSMREFLEILLQRMGHEVRVADGGQAGLAELQEREFDLVITDLKMPKVGGLRIVEETKKHSPDTEVIIVTAFATAETAISAMKQGAYDYLTKPFKVDEISAVIDRALEKRSLVRDNTTLRRELEDRHHLENLVGRSDEIKQVFDVIRKVAVTNTSVLIMGESGTGKELAARAIHNMSKRADGPFVPINCGAIPDTLMESELFGHVRGSFTGASSDKEGLFEAANRGTVFLDEIAELSQPMQVKLLRTLQERTIKQVGATKEKKIDIRVLAATDQPLDEQVSEGNFRSDLFYRLNVIPLRLPALRQRREDIALLVEHFLRKFAATSGQKIRGVTPEAMALLGRYHYPGNVRELENMIERAITLNTGDQIDASALPELNRRANPTADFDVTELPKNGLDLDAHMADIERELVMQAMDRTNGKRTDAARLLGISLRSIRYRLSKFGVEPTGDDKPNA